jgi:choline dehydrogenase-like flavoprotein
MYFDANQLPDGATLRGFDICIVGAGAAGIAMAARLIPSNKKVLMVSSGPPSAPVETPANESMYKGVLGPFLRKVDPEFLTRSRLRMYGGTTNHFYFWARPLEDADLTARPGYRDASWPLDISELDRYYPDANDTGGYGPFNYDDIGFWADASRGAPFPPLAGDALRNAILHAQPDDKINHFQEQFGPALEAATNIIVLHNANALMIEATAGRDHVVTLACGSIAAGRPNKYFKVDARSHVLAQGGIEVVRLLKISGGLGDNAKRQLGRGFMLHPVIIEAAKASFSAPVDVRYLNFFKAQEVRVPRRLPAVAHHASAPPWHSFLSWGNLAPTPETMARRKIGNFRLKLHFESATFTSVEFTWEQVPNENSAITLDPVVRDPVFDQPVVRLDWNLVEQDKRTAREGLDLCRQYLLARDGGAKFEITTDLGGGPDHWTLDGSEQRLQAGDHHMGAARMSEHPDDGIVNPDSRLHGIDNLYIASSAVFPTSGQANPTLTIVALALRLADHLNRLP